MPTTTSSVDTHHKRLDRNVAQTCLWLNLLALPGLGTWLAGKRFVGVVQAVLALAGFVLTGFWILSYMALWLRTEEFPADGGPHLRLGLLGVVLFAVAWVWALGTSLRVLRKSRGGDL